MIAIQILLLFIPRLTYLNHSMKEVIASKIQDMSSRPRSISKDFNRILYKFFDINGNGNG